MLSKRLNLVHFFYFCQQMKFTASQIAGILEGDIVGNPDVEVFKLSKIEEGIKGL